MNEQEITTKVVLPFLRRLGLDPDDLSFQQSFALHFGTHQLVVDGVPRHSGTVGARLDILVTHNALPLLVVEVKEGGHVLTEMDRDQAASYAKLLHPPAPYALVTNGTDYRLYDSITKREIKTGDFTVRNGYELVVPEGARNEAIDLFLGYSPNNLLRFCESQVAEQLRPLTGSPHDVSKKYVPELTVPRVELREALAAFERGKLNGFLLLADSGRGKTSALCDYVCQRQAEQKLTLFFAGNRLEGNILAALTSEFNWAFTEQITAAALVKRLDAVAKGAPIVIVLDGLDEWTYAQKAQSLLGFLVGTQHLGIKLVFSCKAAAWENISRPTGSDIGFASHLFNPDGTIPRSSLRGRMPPADIGAEPLSAIPQSLLRGGFIGGAGDETTDGYRLGPMSNAEFFAAIDRYREVFGVRGAFEDKVLDEARHNPFLLRVMFVVAAKTGTQSLTFSSRDFFEHYLDRTLLMTGRRDIAEAQLIGVAQSMVQRNCAPATEEDIRADLSLSPADPLLTQLFEQNVLQRSPAGITFYFQQLRDYLIAFRVRRWGLATPAQLAAIKPVGVEGEAFAFYLRYATDTQIRAVVGPIMPNAEQYLHIYTDTIHRHFPALCSEFEPGGNGPIGFVAEYIVPRKTLGAYGFKRRQNGKPLIQLVPVERYFSKSNLLNLIGARGLHHASSSNGFCTMDVHREVIEHEVIRQLDEMLKERKLNLSNSIPLVHEAVIGLVKSNPKTFPRLFDTECRVLRFPLHIKDIQAGLRRARLLCHFEHEFLEGKRREGRIEERWHGDFVTYSPASLSPDERAGVAAQVEAAMASNSDPELRAVSLNLRELEEAFGTYGIHATSPDFTINAPPWVSEYYLAGTLRRDYAAGSAALREHLGKLLRAFLSEYARVVDTNFPTLKAACGLRAQMPVRVLVEFYPDMRGPSHEIDGQLSLICERLPTGTENEVVFCAPGELVVDHDLNVTHSGRPVHPDHWISSKPLHASVYTPGFNEPLHDLLYESIREDWPVILNELRRQEKSQVGSGCGG